MAHNHQRCDCHGREVLASVIDHTQTLEVKARTHGATHSVEFTLSDLVDLLDPQGTSYVPNTTGSAVL